MDTRTYRKFHEDFMIGLNGTTVSDTFSAITPSFLTIFLTSLHIIACNKGDGELLHIREFLWEFFLIIIPAILSFTVLADYIFILCISLMCAAFGILFYGIYSHEDVQMEGFYQELLNLEMSVNRKPFITNFRAITNVMTAISILAVDFTVFPRRFAKTETYGYSLMDTGVGLFCISNSLISPSVLSYKMGKRRNSSIFRIFISTFKTCIPLLILGGIRFLAIKQADYQVHVSEYGVHWNFFITLAIAKLISSAVMPFYCIRYSLGVSCLLIGIHEFILWVGVEDWVLSNIPRTTFISANREGIASCLGYVALFTAGEGMGHFIFYKYTTFGDYIILNSKLLFLSTFLWICTFMTKQWFSASRRLANMGYYIWILTFGVTALTVFLLSELVLEAYKFYIRRKSNQDICKIKLYIPVILQAVSYNGLVFFLLANVLTGIINMSCQTLLMSEFVSVITICLYMLLTCLIIFILYYKNIRLKVW